MPQADNPMPAMGNLFLIKSEVAFFNNLPGINLLICNYKYFTQTIL
jgi:hypothetical protein